MSRTADYEMNMTEGALLPKIIRFSIPLMLTSMLQLFYNAADVIVVGRFAGSEALAAVSSTGSLINLIVNLFMGLSLGASVLVAQAYGAGNHREVSDVVHTAMTTAVICGLAVGAAGLLLSRQMLEWMNSPPEVIELSALYLSIYFSGSIFNMVYNFGAAILRAVGDTRRPMFFLVISGVINIVFNLIFVIVFHMSVAGVALATIMSQAVSAVLVVNCLRHTASSIHLDLRRLRIQKPVLVRLVKIGLPAGLQASIFSVSNVLIQSAVNSFGADAMAGNGAAANIEGFIYTSMSSLYQAALTFTSQNVGAKKAKRIGRIMVVSQTCSFVVGLGLGLLALAFAPTLLSIYTPEDHVIAMGIKRMAVICPTYFLCGYMDVMVGGLRGMGKSMVPMFVSILGACVLRVIWVYTIFAQIGTLTSLYYSYPISWLITGTTHLVYYLHVKRQTIQGFALNPDC